MSLQNQYVGVKVVVATPMCLGEYNQYRGWTIPADEDPSKEGYLVTYPDGYESWCPRQQFEEANRPIDGMTFGHAKECLKKGMKVARAGWNGKGMWVELQTPDERSKMTRPYLYMVCPKGSTNHFGEQTRDFERIPWLPSQTDILAEDWEVVE